MYVIKFYDGDGKWRSWGCAANPSVINKLLDLFTTLHPKTPVVVDHA